MSEMIDADTLARDASTLCIIDIRKKPDGRQIPGAIRYDGEALLNAEFLPFHFNDKIVVYCGSGNSSQTLAAELRERGYNARYLEGGYAKWKDSLLPTTPIEPPTTF